MGSQEDSFGLAGGWWECPPEASQCIGKTLGLAARGPRARPNTILEILDKSFNLCFFSSEVGVTASALSLPLDAVIKCKGEVYMRCF